MALLRVTTKYGEIEGLTGWNQAVSLFRGIPYAKAPVGELRWKAPQPCEPWEGVYKAYNWGNISYQERRPSEGGNDVIGNEFYCVDWPRDEDCLYLNVWTPAKTTDAKLPVGVYLHGGGYSQGYGHLNCYDGEGFAKRGVIMVSINHRLGMFGYLAHPELTAEDTEHHSSGNYGIMDIVAALQWVKENIAAFGGDPEKVSVFGQSGGGNKSLNMIVSPLAKGLIRGAIMQSGGGINRVFPELTLESSEAIGKTFIEFCGYKSIAEARQASQEELLEHYIAYKKANGIPMEFLSPCADGYVFPKHWNDLAIAGEFPDIQTMIGCTAEEFMNNAFLPDGPAVMPTREQALADGEKYCGPGQGEAFLKAIKYDTDPAYAREMYRKMIIMTGGTQAGMRAWCENQLRRGKKPAYSYFVTIVPPGADSAHHSAEHHYVFQTLGKSSRPYSGKDWDLSNQLADYWANFIKNLDPNGEGLPEWTPYTEDSKQSMHITYGPHMDDAPNSDLVLLLTKAFGEF